MMDWNRCWCLSLLDREQKPTADYEGREARRSGRCTDTEIQRLDHFRSFPHFRRAWVLPSRAPVKSRLFDFLFIFCVQYFLNTTVRM